MEYITLNNGTKAPLAGIGTFLMSPRDAEEAVYNALTNGYRLIDTANAYMNEKAVGRGVKRSGLKREEIYLVTRLWPSVYADADKTIDETLSRLGTDYVDLMFLHQPVGDYIGAYKAMERAVRAGKVKSLGLSNFPEEKIKEVVDACEIKPAFVQVETGGEYCRGATVSSAFGAENALDLAPNARCVLDLDRQGFVDYLCEAVASYGY